MEKKIRTFTGFAGFGGDKFAMQLADIKYKEIGFSEVDKFAIQCHKQNHKGQNFGDMTKIFPELIPDFDLFTGGFPCQSFSIAGKGLGTEDARGQLFQHIIRICEIKKPKYILLENVKGLMSKKHSEFFEFTKSELKRIGYNIDVSLYNSKEYGIPQNRERVFYVCIRNDLEFKYNKPIKIELDLLLKDILEIEVDKKYYLSGEKIKILLNNNNWNCNPPGNGMNGKVHTGNISATITTNKGEGHKIAIPCITPDRINKRQNGRRFKTDGETMFTLNTQDRHGVLIDKNKNYYLSGKIYKNGDCGNANRIFKKSGVSQSIQVCTRTKILDDLTIRKLTPKECFRLMGFLNDQINLDGISNSQRYKLAGNGWEINLVSKIMKGFLK